VTKNATQPRIYCADLSSYGAGVLHGAWIDADQDADDIRAEIADMLRKSPHPNTVTECPKCSGTGNCPASGRAESCEECNGTGEVPTAEEWAIHDYEGFEGIKLSEHEDIDTVADLAKAIQEHGEAFAAWYGNENRDDVDTDRFREAYRGTYKTLADYAEQVADDMGVFDNVNATFKFYFDFEKFGDDMEMGGDIWTAEGGDGIFVFDNH
jgi:antirestriction protein